jgi:Pectate lyase superfamily protein/Major tropism determinant N-terminal domain
MSVIQISKIQVRRGRKGDVGSVPQLSSAEFAWAVDTQELYIGNGSVSEGAPYVGNTKILTEHDNLLELTSGYQFASTDLIITRSVTRSLQSKLDETVSVVDYGAVPDGSTDCTLAFEAAFADLFKSVETTYRKVLLVPNGRYSFNLPNRPLRIPSWATIHGENIKETVLDVGNSGIEFVSTAGTEPGNFSDSDFPNNIKISNLTIDHGDGQTEITASRNCEFEKVRWTSDYQTGDTVFEEENANGVYLLPIVSLGGKITVSGPGVDDTIEIEFTEVNQTYQLILSSLIGILNEDDIFQTTFIASAVGTSLKVTMISEDGLASAISSNLTIVVQTDNLDDSPETVAPILTEYQDGSQNVQSSVYWDNLSFSTRTTDIAFKACEFENVRLGTECQQSAIFSTQVQFVNCRFFDCDTGIYIGGIPPSGQLGSQGNLWNITDCVFEEIYTHAFWSTFGIGTKFSRTNFKNCGIGGGTIQFPRSSIVKFGENLNNVLANCSSTRHQDSSIVTTENPATAAIVEFENTSKAELVDKNYASIFLNENISDIILSTLPIANKFIELDYFLILGSHSRKGTLTIAIGAANNTANVGLYDEYTYSSISPSAPGGALMTNFEFGATVETLNSISTIALRYRNPIDTGSLGTISYSITYGG